MWIQLLCALAVGVAGRVEIKNGQKVFYAEADNNCVVQTDEGSIDISALPTTAIDMPLGFSAQLYTWVNSWCREETLLPSGASAGATTCDAMPAYFAMYEPSTCFFSSTVWDTPLQATKVDGVWQISYSVKSTGGRREEFAKVTVTCGANPSGKPVDCVVRPGESHCNVRATLGASGSMNCPLDYRSPLVCPSTGGSSSGGCKAACAFLLIFFLGTFVYLAAGMAYNYKFKEMRGVETVPHLEFWKSVPGLMKDGGVFAFEKTKGLASCGRSGEEGSSLLRN